MRAVTSPGNALARASLIVPAHNEAGRIESLLPVLVDAATAGYLVVVVANGCADQTAALVAQHPELTLVELAEASKAAALRAGDQRAGDVFPRLYLDADARVDLRSLDALVAALRGPAPLAVRPRSTRDTTGCSSVARRIVRGAAIAPSAQAWAATHLEGHALYATNAAGRARFDVFPDLIADDAFFDRMFDADQKRVVQQAHVTVRPPTTWAEFERTLTRVYLGNLELAAWLRTNRPDRQVPPGPRRSIGSRLRSLNAVVRFDRSGVDDVVAVALNALVRRRAQRRARRRWRRGHDTVWR
jgi:glycosyltransferase involved in cell wall biosynthesis